MGLLVNGLGMEIERADENVPAGFDLPRQIFLACEVLNRLLFARNTWSLSRLISHLTRASGS